MAEHLVRVRITGPASAVAVAAERVRLVLNVVEESRSYPNRDNAGARRYLSVLVPAEDVIAAEVRDRG